MKRHAFLILFHQDLPQVRDLIARLDHPRSLFVLHADAKMGLSAADRAGLCAAARQGRVIFAPSHRVNWGGYSQIRAQLSLWKTVLDTGEEFSHLHLISGADLPIKPVEEILAFFDRHPGREFIHFDSVELSADLRERFTVSHPFQEHLRTSRLARAAERAVIHLQKKWGRDRVKKETRRFGFGANWCSITPSLAGEVLSREREIRRLFRRTRCCDEIFLQTLVLDSPFEKALYLPPCTGGVESNLRLVDWKRGDPYVFREGDLEELLSSPCLFARKFTPDVSGALPEQLRLKISR